MQATVEDYLQKPYIKLRPDYGFDWDGCQTELERILFLIKNMEKLKKQSKPYVTGDYEEIFKPSYK